MIKVLIRLARRREKAVELADAGHNGGDKGFNHVLRNKDGSITILANCQQLPDGSVELAPDAEGGAMQMSDQWVRHVLPNLDPSSPARIAVQKAIDDGTLCKGLICIDRVTGNLNMVRLK